MTHGTRGSTRDVRVAAWQTATAIVPGADNRDDAIETAKLLLGIIDSNNPPRIISVTAERGYRSEYVVEFVLESRGLAAGLHPLPMLPTS